MPCRLEASEHIQGIGTALPGSGGEICGKQVGNQRVPGVGRRNQERNLNISKEQRWSGNSGRISGKRGLGQFLCAV